MPFADASPEAIIGGLLIQGGALAILAWLVRHVVLVMMPAVGREIVAQLAAERAQCERWFQTNAAAMETFRRENERDHKETRHGLANNTAAVKTLTSLVARDLPGPKRAEGSP